MHWRLIHNGRTVGTFPTWEKAVRTAVLRELAGIRCHDFDEDDRPRVAYGTWDGVLTPRMRPGANIFLVGEMRRDGGQPENNQSND